MKINQNDMILMKNSVLVPYEPCHVPKYHEWMEDEEIRRLTGSERLTLAEEFEMQQKWRNDEDKLTFIVLDKTNFEGKKDQIESMIGDVNLFINWEEKVGEVEVMIAESDFRGKGVASEAVSAIICYAIQKLKISKFFAKIVDDNTPSLQFFEKKMKFERISHSKVFGEYTLELSTENIDHFSKYIDDSNGSIVSYSF